MMKPNQSVSCHVRVTAAYPLRNQHYVFTGVFVRGANRTVGVSAKAFVKVICHENKLSIEPAVGQIFKLTGHCSKVIKDATGYELTECLFENPTQIKLILPAVAEEFINFIVKEPDFIGIGSAKARKLFDTFGAEVFDLLANHNHAQLSQCLTPEAASALIKGYQKYENLASAMWLAERKVPPRIQMKLFKYYKKKALDQVKDNPYILQTFGLPFADTDTLARTQFNITTDDPRRLNAIVEWAMREHCQAGGHTLAYCSDLFKAVLSITQDDELAEQAIMHTASNLGIHYDEVNKTIHHTGSYIMEKMIARRLIRLCRLPGWLVVFDDAYRHATENLPFALSPKQGEAVLGSLESSVFCLTGGAGTGKTTVMKTIVDAYQHAGFEVFATALSGRAAKRLQESIGLQTYTIHRLTHLKDATFESESPKVLIIDEASMVDVSNMYRLIMKIPADTRIILTGDDAQLGPIGAGLVLSEVVNSGILPVVELDIVQRQSDATGIPSYSREIRYGRIPASLSHKNIQFHACPKETVVEKVVDLYRNLKKEGEVQVIAPTRKLTQEINSMCQAILNPYGVKVLLQTANGEYENTGLRLNDPVIFTRNDYKKDLQNGTLGKIVALNKEKGNGTILSVEIDTGETKEIGYDHIDNLELAYAITLHKAQGSQFDQVIVPIVKSRLLDNSWVYTATTRAVQHLYLLGSDEVFRGAIETTSSLNERQVALAHLLQQENLLDENDRIRQLWLNHQRCTHG